MNGRRGLTAGHPLPCFFYYGMCIGLTMLLRHPLFTLASLAGAVCLTGLQGLWRKKRQHFFYYVIVALATFLINPLVSHRGRHILFYWWDQPVTLEAIGFGAGAAVSLLATLLWFLSFSNVASTDKWMYLLHRPAPKTSLLLSMASRNYHLLFARLGQIAAVQKSRGISPLHGKLLPRLRSGMLLLQAMLTWTLEEGLQTADSMKARGFGSGRRSNYWPYNWSLGDRMFLAASLLLALTVMAGWLLHVNRYDFFPSLQPLSLSRRGWAEYAAYLGFIALPSCVEGGSRLRWRKFN